MHLKSVRSLLFAASVLAATHADGQAASDPVINPATTIAIVNVTVIPMDTERSLSNHTVVFSDGLITDMGPTEKVKIPDGAVRIDGREKFLMPGLADMHVHLGSEGDMLLNLANGVTTVRNMWGAPMHLRWREEIASGNRLGPTLYTTGPLMDGTPPIWEGSTVVDSPDSARALVKEQAEAGYDFIKVYNRLSRASYAALLAAAREFNIPAVGHVPDSVGLMDVMAAGQYSIEHLEGYTRYVVSDDSPYKYDTVRANRLVNCNYIDPRKIDEAVQKTLSSGVWNCVTLVVWQKFVSTKSAEEFLARPEMKYVEPSTLASWDPSRDFRLKTLTDEQFGYYRKWDTVRAEITRALHEAGAPILLGTDTPNPFVVPGFAIHEELRNLVDAGFTPFEAIKAGTCDAAKFLHALDQFGTIAVGKRADLILTTASPLDNVANIKNPEGVMVRGKWLPRDVLQHKLDSLVTSYHTPKERFLGMQPLESEGVELARVDFEIAYNDLTIGEERYLTSRLEPGTTQITTQLYYDPPYETKVVERAVYNALGDCTRLDFESTSDDGVGRLSIVAQGDTMVLAGRQENGDTIQIKNIAATGTILRSYGAAGYAALWPRIKDLKEHDSVTVNAVSVSSYPVLELTPEIVKIKRTVPDSSAAPGTLVYAITVSDKSESSEIEMSFNANGDLQSLRENDQMGVTAHRLKL